MCGIAGLFDLESRSIPPAIAWQMIDLQRHRGPDDQGVRQFSLHQGTSAEHLRGTPPAEFEGCLGFTRLSILDLSQHGHQPMCSADGLVSIVFNGEIYNAFDFRPELERAGYRFHSKSDTEILLNLYHRDGIEPTLARLNGMFAFCIVDLRSGELHLARDRIGIKPLYWTQHDGLFMFASELKAFFAHPDFRPSLDRARADECLAYRYCAGERTLLDNVYQLRPGHRLRIAPAQKPAIEIGRYWSIPDAPIRTDLSFEQAVDQLQQIIEQSVRRQLISDVKVGCQLSGGIDSSLITLLAARQFKSQMDIVSIITEDPNYSEDAWITRAAASTGIETHRYLLTADYAVDHYDLATWHLDEPMNPPSTVGIYLMAAHARSFMTVLLSGEGADELFGGYERFCLAAVRPRLLPWLKFLQSFPGKVRRRARELGDPAITDPVDWFLHRAMFMTPQQFSDVRIDGRLDSALAGRRELFAEGRGDFIANCCKYELQTYLVSQLTRQDKMTMAHSVEDRVPLLDNAVVEFVRSLPTDYLVRGAWGKATQRMHGTKRILKALAARYFDDDFVYRRKMGFGFSLRGVARSTRFREMMEDRLLPGIKRRGLLREEVVRQWWQQAITQTVLEDPLWNCISFELWAQLFLDGRRHSPGPSNHYGRTA